MSEMITPTPMTDETTSIQEQPIITKDEQDANPVIVISDHPEVQPESKTSPIIFPSFGINDNKWTEPASKLLLTLYVEKEDKFNDPHTKKKQVWGEVSDVLRAKGYMFDADKCERKFLNLKTVYRNTVHHNTLIRNFDRKCSFFDELENIFHLAEKAKNKLPSESEGNSETWNKVVGQVLGSRPVPVRLYHASDRTPNTMVQQVRNTPPLSNGRSNSGMNGSENGSPTSPVQNAVRPVNSIQRQNLNTHLRQSFASRVMASSPVNRQQQSSQHYAMSSESERPMNNGDIYKDTPAGTAIIDLCRESTSGNKRTGSEVLGPAEKRHKPNPLQNLLESFETYRREQREREDQRMQVMKEMHEDEMRVTNRFLDIIQQCVKGSKLE